MRESLFTGPDQLPRQAQLVLPLLEQLVEMGGSAKAGDAVEALSDRLQVPPELREKTVTYTWPKWGSRTRSPWKQQVHWARYHCTTRGLLEPTNGGRWTVTQKGKDALANCQPGVILVVYTTPSGEAVWADAVTAAGQLRDNSVDLLFTSTPYPLAGKGRDYGNLTDAETIELIMKCAPDWRRALTDTGSLVLNMKDCWLPRDVAQGAAVRSLYIDKLLIALVEEAKLFFSDRHFWRNPSCGPTTPWVTTQKVRCGCDIEHVLWLSKSGRPYADTKAVMAPAKPSTVAAYLAKARQGAKARVGPSGQNNVFEEAVAKAAAGEQIMVLPRTIQEYPNSDPQVRLTKMIREAGLPKHPAQMPLDLARFWVKLTTRPNDHCYDPFAGWNTLGVAAEELGRTWTASDRSLSYLVGSAYRFDSERVCFEPEKAA